MWCGLTMYLSGFDSGVCVTGIDFDPEREEVDAIFSAATGDEPEAVEGDSCVCVPEAISCEVHGSSTAKKAM